ncbi:Phytoene/squalene synthetase [Candidatus Terasakiella magnetica]|nr:Phytoene/squalene synthetase [Candidatus Terasakiella magnetica]
MASPLSYAASQVHDSDRERFVTALFAPEERREALLSLYAFNLEVAKIRESVREPMAGLIRLQWWRDTLAAGADGKGGETSPIAGPLIEVMRRHTLPLAEFEMLLEAREQDLGGEGPATRAAALAYADASAGTLVVLALRVLGVTESPVLEIGRRVGTAVALVGHLRALGFHLSTGRLTLPADVLAQAGTSVEEVQNGKASIESLAATTRIMAEMAEAQLSQARRQKVPRSAIPALLPALLAEGHLATLRRFGWNPFVAQVQMPRTRPIRLAWASLTGRF